MAIALHGDKPDPPQRQAGTGQGARRQEGTKGSVTLLPAPAVASIGSAARNALRSADAGNRGEETKGRTHALGTLRSNGTPTYGVVEGDTIIPVRGSPFDAWERTPTRLHLADVKLLVPVVPPTFYACGMNYPEHVREFAAKLGRSRTCRRSPTSAIAPTTR